MGRHITLWMDTRSRCLRISCSPSRWRRYAPKNLLLHSRPILEVSNDLLLAVSSAMPLEPSLYNADTKTNVQTYVSPEEVASWLQRKKEGMFSILDIYLKLAPHAIPAGEDLPILLQQAPKSQSQASATIIRGLLDPILAGKPHITPYSPIPCHSYHLE
jgi:hypothetical protein